jgi:hypothetical protein
MNVGVGIYPHDAQGFVGVGGLDARDGGVGRAVVAGQHQRKLAEAQGLLHGPGNALLHGVNGVDVLGEGEVVFIEKNVVEVGHGHGVEAPEIVGALVETGHAQGVDAHAGPAGAGPQLGADFQKFNTFHRAGFLG